MSLDVPYSSQEDAWKLLFKNNFSHIIKHFHNHGPGTHASPPRSERSEQVQRERARARDRDRARSLSVNVLVPRPSPLAFPTNDCLNPHAMAPPTATTIRTGSSSTGHSEPGARRPDIPNRELVDRTIRLEDSSYGFFCGRGVPTAFLQTAAALDIDRLTTSR